MKRLSFILPLLLLMSCSDAVPKEKQTHYKIWQGNTGSISCKLIKFTNMGGTNLYDCTSTAGIKIKEIINATNIIIYE